MIELLSELNFFSEGGDSILKNNFSEWDKIILNLPMPNNICDYK